MTQTITTLARLFAAVGLAVSTSVATPDEKTPKTAPTPSKTTAITDISAVEANDYLSSDSRVRDKVVVLDIRTAKEFEGGHIKGAKNINFLGKDFKEKLAKLDRDTIYVMHCRSGGRSGRAKKTFKELGFRRILHIQDGYNGWASAGFSVEKGAATK